MCTRKALIETRYLNGLGNKKGSAIYKYIGIKNLISMIKNKELKVYKVSSWEDPYENFLLKDIDISEKVGTSSLRKKIFGQSWTLREESDLMWRIYSKMEKFPSFSKKMYSGVRIKTRARKLFDIFIGKECCVMERYIGKVKYFDEASFISKREELNEDLKGYFDYKVEVPRQLFVKRKDFFYEKEVRIINIAAAATDEENERIERKKFESYKIRDIDDFIEEICLDPRLDKDGGSEQFDFLKKLLVEVGIDEKKIKKSELHTYKPIAKSC